MKDYIGGMVDLTGDSYLNPVGAAYGDGTGTHQRSIGSITSISVHHDATPRPHDYDSIARYKQEAQGHYARLGPGLQYHYKIDNTGVIFKIRPLETWLYVVGSEENTSCIAICLDGEFEPGYEGAQNPTREQFEALYQLCEELCERHPEFPATWPDVRPHADYSSTDCCGANLRNHIYPIQDKASAQAQLLNQGEYDWPEFQPHLNPTPTPPAAPMIPAVTPPPSDAVSSGQVDAGKEATGTIPVESKTPSSTPHNIPSPYQPGVEAQAPSESGKFPMLTVPLVNTIIRSIKDFFTMSNNNRLRSRKFWLTVAANVIAVGGALVHYFTATQTATLAGAATAVYVVIQGLIDSKNTPR